MIMGFVQNESTLIVSGIPAEVPRATLQDWGEDIAQIVEAQIAEDFADEYGAGRPLGSVSTDYDEHKAEDGLDLRRGHATGNLQDELDAGGFERVSVSRGRITIRFDEEALYARVEYAEYYAQDKVSGGRILKVLKKHAASAQQYVRDRVERWERSTRRAA